MTQPEKLGPPKVHVKIEVFSNDKKNPAITLNFLLTLVPTAKTMHLIR